MLAVVGVLAVVALWIGGGYNGLVSTDENVKNKWADVEVQYQRRMDLIPNIVNTVKGAANFEQKTLNDVISARSAWAQAKNTGDINGEVAAATNFDGALSRLLVTVEAYPDLKATAAFRDLTTELEGTENRVAVARRDYNAAVKDYNLKTRQFPSNILAGIFNFNERTSFEAQQGAETAPAVNFGQ